MKIISYCLLLTVGLVFAYEVPGAGPAGPNVTGCAKWTGLRFCKDWYGLSSMLGTEATICQQQHGVDGFEVFHQVKKVNGQPTVTFYKIYTKKCLVFIIDGNSTGLGTIRNDMLAQLDGLFAPGSSASNTFFNDENEMILYVLDAENGQFHQTRWDEQGILIGIQTVDSETDGYFNAVLAGPGLAFGPLIFE